MRQSISQFEVVTRGRGFHSLDEHLQRAVEESGISSGLLHLFLCHTSASLVVSENADPDVLRDLETVMSRLGPDGDPAYRHRLEGADDMAAHVRSVLTLTEISLPVRAGRLSMGTWQGLYLWEHRYRPHRRRLEVTVQGE